MASWVIFSTLLPSMEASSSRKAATRLSRLFHMTCSMSHMTSENREAMISLVKLDTGADSCMML